MTFRNINYIAKSDVTSSFQMALTLHPLYG